MSSPPARTRWVLPLVLVTVALTFVGVLDNGFVNWDDGPYVVLNPLVVDPSSHAWTERLTTPALGYPVPIVVWLYGLLWQSESVAWPFHLLSLGVHLVNTALAWWWLRRDQVAPVVAAVAALGFAVHPIVVEPVAWATGLKDLLAATGVLVAVLGLRRGWPALGGAVLAFGSKPSTILLVVPLVARVWTRPPSEANRPVGWRWGLIAVVGLAGLGLAAFTVGQETEAARTSGTVTFSAARVLGALGLQLQHVVAPATLAPRYTPESAGVLALALGGVAILASGWLGLGWVRRRDPRLSWLAVAWAAYLPVSNLHPLERYTADSYFYLPWLGIVGCVALSWQALEAAVQTRGRPRVRLIRALVAVVVLAWVGLSVAQVEAWSDSRALWRDAYLGDPSDPEVIYRYGDALGRSGDERAELAIYLEHEEDLRRGRMIPVVLPVHHERAGNLDQAVAWYRRAFESPLRQDDGIYWYYVEFVGRHPERHDPALDPALRHALASYHEADRVRRLDAEQRGNLAEQARRLGLVELAVTLAGGDGPTQGAGGGPTEKSNRPRTWSSASTSSSQ